MKVLKSEKMTLHRCEFRFEKKRYDNGTVRSHLYKIVNGQENLIKEISNFDEGRDYLDNQYAKDWKEFVEFTDLLCDSVLKNIHTFDYDDNGETAIHKFLKFEYKGQVKTVEVDVIITTVDWKVTDIQIDWMKVMFDSRLDDLVELFVAEWYRRVKTAFTYKLVS